MGLSSQSTNGNASFLKTDGGKTKPNAIEVPSISLPKGGGAIKGIDEKFSVNAVNGTSSFSIPLPFSPARGLSPSLALSYKSGEGNGVFGLGWTLSLSSIKRKTDKGLPQYMDDMDSDTFLFSEAEDLVPEFKKQANGAFQLNANGDYIISEKDSADSLFTIRFYRPRIEGLFARIERWSNKATLEIKWRVITKNNVTTLFGWSENSRLADPADSKRIYKWLPEFVFDDRGNCAQYVYKKEDTSGFDATLLHHKNRLKSNILMYTNTYLEKVLYGNKTPYKKFGDSFPSENAYLFSTVFDYGEYDLNAPYQKIKSWDFRADAFSDYKAGFEIRTARLCWRVLFFHHFTAANEYDGLVRSLNFDYTNALAGFTFLTAVTSCGYIKQSNGSYTTKNLPPLEFDYQKHDWNKEVRSISTDQLVHAPAGLDEQQYQFVDLFNEGLSGILTEQSNGWYYKRNIREGKFEQAKLISPKPSFAGLEASTMQLVDMDADGGRQLVSMRQQPKGYFELNDDEQWQSFRSFESLPNIDFTDDDTRLLDLNGDGKPEVLVSEDQVFTWYESKGRKGFSPARQTAKSMDEEAGPAIVFSDKTQSIFLADMSGDGLSDIVRIRNGDVCYWPNLGYGKFGAKVSMDGAPVFDRLDSFNPAFIRLADIDGSGTTDIIYLGKAKFSCWMNLNGNAFNPVPFEIDNFPDIHQQSKVAVTDLLGNGVACIVWSSMLSKDARMQLKYIDLMNGRKPHVLTGYKNNLGKEVTLEYQPSTKFYIDDKLAGKPWITKLHFPVHCISRTETRDKISGYRFITSYAYHHGYYDHDEREFRGFGMVEQTDAEHFEHWVKGNASNIVDQELHQEPVVSKTWFHTGAFLSREKILHHFAGEHWYEEMKRHGFNVTHYETPLADARVIAAPGIDPVVIEQLSFQEWREALRACKGMSLRSEVFAHDAAKYGDTPAARKQELTPFAVVLGNCVIELLQPKGKNKHAVFVVKPGESLTYNYERNMEDARVAHNLTIKIDEYGNVVESVAVVYPRRMPDTSLPVQTQQAQSKAGIIFTQNQFTNDVVSDDVYRLRTQSEVKTFELKGIKKNAPLYTIADFDNILSAAQPVPYHQTDIDPAPGAPQMRLIEHIRTIYYRNDLTGPLPLHKMESMAIPFESYQLAYTPELLYDIFGSKVDASVMSEGKFTHSEGDDSWWIRSGSLQLTEGPETQIDAQDRFYVPISYTDPYGATTKVKYYEPYFLFINQTEDALGNKAGVSLYNFRTLAPQRMKDINGNLSEVLVDELGFVKAIALMGKGNEADDLSGLNEFTNAAELTQITNFFDAADSTQLTSLGKVLLQHATSRFVYDFDVYEKTGGPVVVAGIHREEHYKKNNNSPVQLSFEYSNGLGQVVMKKVQAEPGKAKKVVINADNACIITETDTSTLNPIQLRWIGNGRKVVNNKGNAVKQYESYFSTTHHYENFKELVESGVTPVMYYDAVGRVVKTDMPDGTFTKVDFDSWKQTAYDASDTVLESAWYNNRVNRLIDVALLAEGKDPVREKEAAVKASMHANTPDVMHFNVFGRPILSTEHNKNTVSNADELYHTRVKLDVEGNLRLITDARGNALMEYKYDILGNNVYQKSMDSGQRWLLTNILGNPLRTWDERNHEFQVFYDILHRHTHSKVVGGDDNEPLDHVFDRVVYGESLLLPGRTNEASIQAKNILGQILRHYDTGGMILTPTYDLKGQPVTVTRRLFKKYQDVANWIDANLSADLETYEFTVTTQTDALGRITRQTTPDGSVITPTYNEAGLLTSEKVRHSGHSQDTTYIKDIDYNEKGQRSKIIYGNDVITKFYYDRETLRLKRLETKRQNNDRLQDWNYTYDPVGNITHMEDKNIPVTFFNNQKITGISEYTYDALYRLIEASGRENSSMLTFSNDDNWNDAPYMHQLNPGDPMSVRQYTQQYRYDAVGNILQMKHNAASNSWTRDYVYETVNNRLKTTQTGSQSYNYQHHNKHGFMTAMPHLEDIGWNFKEEVIRSIRQRRTDGGTPETTYYQYDGDGQRIRKITENTADVGVMPTLKDERVYIGGYEVYKIHSGPKEGLERISLSLIDEGHRFVMFESETEIRRILGIPVGRTSPVETVRYQLHNHVGSCSLELNESAQVIGYEEYHPYGTTAYQAKNASIAAAAKRYRYLGMERDDETGLSYHSERYYITWLGRWLSADPIGVEDGVNVYAYVQGNPIISTDTSGTQSVSFWESQKQYWSGVGEGAAELATGLGNMVAHPIDTAGAIKDATVKAYNQDGVLGAVNQFNPLYHAMVGGYEYYQAASRGDFKEAGKQAFKTVTNLAATAGIAFGGAGLAGGTGATASVSVPTAV
ncbi:MAG: SpvB/TcaC N-terminal domain-containing protein, partial [Bacteroidota bacterium]